MSDFSVLHLLQEVCYHKHDRTKSGSSNPKRRRDIEHSDERNYGPKYNW